MAHPRSKRSRRKHCCMIRAEARGGLAWVGYAGFCTLLGAERVSVHKSGKIWKVLRFIPPLQLVNHAAQLSMMGSGCTARG